MITTIRGVVISSSFCVVLFWTSGVLGAPQGAGILPWTLINGEPYVLLQQRDNKWFDLGGNSVGKETLIQTAAREAAAQTGNTLGSAQALEASIQQTISAHPHAQVIPDIRQQVGRSQTTNHVIYEIQIPFIDPQLLKHGNVQYQWVSFRSFYEPMHWLDNTGQRRPLLDSNGLYLADRLEQTYDFASKPSYLYKLDQQSLSTVSHLPSLQPSTSRSATTSKRPKQGIMLEPIKQLNNGDTLAWLPVASQKDAVLVNIKKGISVTTLNATVCAHMKYINLTVPSQELPAGLYFWRSQVPSVEQQLGIRNWQDALGNRYYQVPVKTRPQAPEFTWHRKHGYVDAHGGSWDEKRYKKSTGGNDHPTKEIAQACQ